MVVAVSFNKRIPPSATGSSRGTLAEIMARQKAAANIKDQYTMEAKSPTIMQGFGNLANIGLNAFKEGRAGADLDIQQARQRELMGKIDPATGATEEQIAAMGEFDPKMMAELWADRAAKLRKDAERDNWQPATAEEKAALGLGADTPLVRNITTGEFKDLTKSDGIKVDASTKGPNKFAEKNAEHFSNQIDTDVQTGAAAKHRGGQLSVLRNLNEDMLRGPQAQLARWGRERFGIQNLGEKADATALFTQIVEGMVPKEREEGSGTMSNQDANMFRNALPSFLTSKQGTEWALDYMQGMADYQQKMGAIAAETRQKYFNDPEGGMKYYTEQAALLPNPLADLGERMKKLGDLPQIGASVAAPAAPPTTGDPKVDLGAAAGAAIGTNAAAGGPAVPGVPSRVELIDEELRRLEAEEAAEKARKAAGG